MVAIPENRNSLKTLKFRNRKLVLAYLRKTGAVSVNDISRFTGLSKMTVHKIIDHYMKIGMVSLTGKGESTDEGGKKPNLFAFNPNCRYIFAVRLADTFMSSCIANLRGDLVAERTRLTITNVDFPTVVAMMRREFDRMIQEHNLDIGNCLAVVVGCNGIVDVENGVCLAFYQNPAWQDNLPIRDHVSAVFPPEIPIRVDSWWRHLAHGEIIASETDARKRFFLIGNSGDYISGGLVADGRVFSGATGFAGEIGHMVIGPETGEKCVCGGVGCLQTLVGPSKIIARAVEQRKDFPDSLVFANCNGEGPTFAAIFEASNQNDDLACQLIDQACSYFALAINNIVQICDPGTVVLYGDYAEAGEFFLTRLRKKVNGMTMCGIDKRTRIEYTSVPDGCGVVGAANLMADALFAAVN